MSELLAIESPCRFELECPAGVHRPGPASLALLKYLFNVKGRSVLDVGSGTGVFAIAAAKLGASEVCAVDADPVAVECTRRNSERNGVKVRAAQGYLVAPFSDRTFDLVVTNPPQTPGPSECRDPKIAGVDGLRVFEALLRQCLQVLDHGGQLLTFVISLADTKRFETLLGKEFRFRALPPERRPFTVEEMNGVHPGLMDFLAERRRQGLSEYVEDEAGLHFLARPYLAMRR
jgi:methylase of polypeptide subunit release factors